MTHRTAQDPSDRSASPTDRSWIEPLLFATGLAVLAWTAPLPLYVLALAVFGLPHVLSEAAWVRRVHGARLTVRWWRVMALVLLVQAGVRLAAWAGVADSQLVAATDLATLLAALAVGLTGLGAVRRPGIALAAGLAAMALLTAAFMADRLLPALALLAVLHNLTPVALCPADARWGRDRRRRLRPFLAALFAFPVVALALLPAAPWAFGAALPHPAELAVLAPAAEAEGRLLSLLALCQCLHYYAVIRLLPGSTTPGAAAAVGGTRRARLLAAALALCAGLTGYFALHYGAARSLYAVAAGAHAWLEWPLILLAVGGWRTVAADPHATPTTGPSAAVAGP